MPPRLQPLEFEDLAGFVDDDHLAAYRCFEHTARGLVAGNIGARPARPPSPALIANARAALDSCATDEDAARRFFERRFRPFRVLGESSSGGSNDGLLTGYYEPHVAGSRVRTDEFRWPLLARPADLVAFTPAETPVGVRPGVSGAKRLPDASLVAYDDRTAIEKQQRDPIVWVRDAAEAFLIQVQGSAQVEFPDGRRARLAYDGRNGLPYTSIGRILIEAGEIAESAMSLAALKAWLRAAGLDEGEPGLTLMRLNRSFVFFRLVEDFDPDSGPVAGAGAPLTPLRSIAIDRTLWAYGLPFWVEAELPWEDDCARPFHRLTVAQDTGSAIVGAARADIFFGGGDAAGVRAGAIRHPGVFVVLLPVGDEP